MKWKLSCVDIFYCTDFEYLLLLTIFYDLCAPNGSLLFACFAIQIIVKEKGVFTNVISPSSKAKLRLLFEVAPLGFLVEKAGGYSSDGTQSVLDKVINNLDERTQVAYGSKNEIVRFEETLYGSSRLRAGVPVGAAA